MSGRLDTLEADPTTATAVSTAIGTESLARVAGDALKLDLAGGTMTGSVLMGNSPSNWDVSTVVKYANGGHGGNVSSIFDGNTNNGWYAAGNSNGNGQGVTFGALTIQSGDTLEVWMDNNGNGSAEIRINQTIATGDAGVRGGYTDITSYIPSFPFELTGLGWYGGSAFTNMWIKAVRINGTIVTDGFVTGGSPAATIGVDGTASFTGNVTASAVPTDNAHLVNKLYADNLVSGVDLSGIATNAAAISTETTARTNADTALSGRLDTLEADPTTQTLLTAEASTRASADTSLSLSLIHI